MIEFRAEWIVSLLMPAQSVLEVRAPHLSFMFQKQYWFRELYLGLRVTASFGRSESYTRVVDGQVRCITPDSTSQTLQVIWNVQFITAFVPAWMVPPIYHSIRRETIKAANQTGELGVRSIRPTWFEDDTSSMVSNLLLAKTHRKNYMALNLSSKKRFCHRTNNHASQH